MKWKNKVGILLFLLFSQAMFGVEGVREIEMINLEPVYEEINSWLDAVTGEKEATEEVFQTAFQKGNHFFIEKQYEKANQAFKSDFSDFKNIFGAATTDRFLGRHTLAIQEYSQVLTSNGNFSEAYLGRALSYRDSGNYEAAVGDFKQYISLTQAEAGYIGLGDTYMAMGRFSEAQAILAQGANKYPTSNLLKKMLSQAYLQTK